MERVSLQRQLLVVTEELMKYVDKHLSSWQSKSYIFQILLSYAISITIKKTILHKFQKD